MKEKGIVFVGLSGGVDSSVAALRLKKQGYTVVGVFIKVWHPDFMVCNWEAERLDAMRVAAHLDIPFLTCDAEAAYRDEVAHYFIAEYKAGRTPNPDVLCNKEVKFGAFMKFARERGADFIATGHYVEGIEGDTGPELHRGKDNNKDQSYFLWALQNEQLAYSLFPVGSSPKDIIRKEAAAAGIPTASKKDSQGVCFLGHIDIPEFLSHYIDLVPGDVLDTNGVVIGSHRSSLVYTIGQRHGFTVFNNDTHRTHLYVVKKDAHNNTITVSSELPITKKSSRLTLTQTVLRQPLTVGETYEAQFRYRQTPFHIHIHSLENQSIEIEVVDEVELPAIGQSCVIYRGDLCLGGGTIST